MKRTGPNPGLNDAWRVDQLSAVLGSDRECTPSTLWSYLEYFVMNADSRSLYGESDRWVWSLRSLWKTDERSRRLWPNPTTLEVNQYKAMDWKGGDKLVLECQCWPRDSEQGIHINWSEVSPSKLEPTFNLILHVMCVLALNAAVINKDGHHETEAKISQI